MSSYDLLIFHYAAVYITEFRKTPTIMIIIYKNALSSIVKQQSF